SFLFTPSRPRSTLFPYTTLFRSLASAREQELGRFGNEAAQHHQDQSGRQVEQPQYAPRIDRLEQRRRCACCEITPDRAEPADQRSEEHTSELQSREKLVCRLPLE